MDWTELIRWVESLADAGKLRELAAPPFLPFPIRSICLCHRHYRRHFKEVFLISQK